MPTYVCPKCSSEHVDYLTSTNGPDFLICAECDFCGDFDEFECLADQCLDDYSPEDYNPDDWDAHQGWTTAIW